MSQTVFIEGSCYVRSMLAESAIDFIWFIVRLPSMRLFQFIRVPSDIVISELTNILGIPRMV